MFTGIVEEVGRIARIKQKGENRRITIEAKNAPKQLKLGDSVAVSGVCLTAVRIGETAFGADLAEEAPLASSFDTRT